ncbi:MAG: oligosaccharide flippase family protein [Polymorphobacter sp.]
MARRFAALGGVAKGYLARNPHILQTIAAFAIKIVGAVLSFGFTILIARAFGPAGVGQFGLAITTLLIASTVALVGTDYILIRTVAGDLKIGRRDLARGAVRSVATMVLITACIMGALLSLSVVPVLRSIYLSADDGLVLQAIAFGVVPIALIRVVSSALRSCGHVLLAQFLDGPASMAIAISIVLLMRYAGLAATVVSAGIAYIAGIAACVLIGAAVQFRHTRGWPIAAVRLRPLLAQGWPILCVVLTGYFIDWLILVVLAAHHSAAEVGIFRTAWQITSIFNLIIVSFDAVAGPRIAAAHRVGDLPGIARTWRQAVAIILMLSLPLFVLTLGFPELLLRLFGSEFTAGAPVLRILALAQLVNVLTGPIGSVLIMTGSERYSLANAMLALVVALIAAFTLIPYLGLTGAALASALTLCMRNIVGWLIVSYKLKLGLLRFGG